MTPSAAPTVARSRLWIGLWIVYVVWGSTYLAIRVMVHPSHGAGLPPLIAAGIRFIVAGGLLFVFTVRRPAADRRPDPLGRAQWLSAAVVGVALLLGGNGLVSMAERRVPSGSTAVIVATVPIWAAVLGAITGQDRIRLRHALGLLLGFGGVAALVAGSGSGRADVTGALILVGGSFSWAAGSVWSRTARLARRPLVMTGMEMLCGGVACLLVGLAIGEAGDLHLGQVPWQAWVALAYLTVFGSMVAYTAYVWVLGNAPLSLATTYAYVNPLVAVLLGAALLHERLTVRTAFATVAIVAGVILMVRQRTTQAVVESPPEPAALPAPEEVAAGQRCA